MASLAAGESSALEELLRRYQRPLAAYIARQTRGIDVDDLHQETWMRVVRGAERFDVSRRFSTWLFQIATNLCRDWHRRRAPEDSVADFESLGTDATARTEAALSAEALLARLPEPQREALVLRYYQDLGESEMSEILGCPRGTVKSRIHNALARLSELLREER
jgi:RNA polymerase sigma-70 factor (ECF subfamily)